MPPTHAPRPARHSGRQKLTLLILALLALVTVFVLPSLAPKVEIVDDPAEAASPPPGPAAVKPSTAAEQTRYRQDAQAVLAEIIAVRDRLTAQNVTAWGAAAFDQAVKQVEAGDEAYGYGGYEVALADYRTALELLATLETSGSERLAEALRDGAAAIEALNQPAAESASALASTIAADAAEVQALTQRVSVLAAISEEVEAGDAARARGELETARDAYQKALSLDPGHQRAAAALAAVRGEITDAQFRRHISRGLAALEQREFEAARAAFREAGAVRPGDPAVQQALQQVESQASMATVSTRLAEAGERETREDWQGAVERYRAILAEDASIVDARVRLVTAEVRAELDRRLEATIGDPLGLSSAQEFEAAKALLADARGVAQPGERLRRQIDTLDQLLAAANSPVEVVLESDNLTHVTVFRVADLGRFERTAIRLRPGRYVAAGTRSGFRDVRVEFTVTGQALDAPIVVRCEEPI